VDPLSLLCFLHPGLAAARWPPALLMQRRHALGVSRRSARPAVITLIHRQESLSLLGFPVVRYIDIATTEGHPAGDPRGTVPAPDRDHPAHPGGS